MIPEKIPMFIRSAVDENGRTSFTGNRMDVPYPLKYWETSKFSSPFDFYWYTNTATGKYHGPNQNFGGPKDDDIVLYDKGTDNPFFAIITDYTQDYVSRECKLKILFSEKEYWDCVKESFRYMYKNDIITKSEFENEMIRVFGIDKGTEICNKTTKQI